jgi:hypothetical protein
MSERVQTTSLQTSEDSHGDPKPIHLPLVYMDSPVHPIQTYPLEAFHELQFRLPFVLIEAIVDLHHTLQILIPLGVQCSDHLIDVGVAIKQVKE